MAAVDDVVDQEHGPAPDVERDIAQKMHLARAGRAQPVAAEAHELDLGRCAPAIEGEQEIGDKTKRSAGSRAAISPAISSTLRAMAISSNNIVSGAMDSPLIVMGTLSRQASPLQPNSGAAGYVHTRVEWHDAGASGLSARGEGVQLGHLLHHRTQRHFAAVPPQRHARTLPRPQRRHQPLEIPGLRHREPVDREDYVTPLEPGLLGRAAGGDAGHEHANGLVEPKALGDLGRQLPHLEAQPAASHLPMEAQLLDHGPGKAGRNSKGNADRTATGRIYRRDNADHVPVEVESRAAGVSAIDRSVDLQEIVIGPDLYIAVACREHAWAYGAAEMIGIAD